MTLDEYLKLMILPPDGNLLRVNDLEKVDWKGLEDESFHGAIVSGEPDEQQSAEILRVLKPGAHLIMIPAQGAGYRGVCALEDGGFEVRDAIYYATEPEGFEYVAKASRSERETGCGHLPAKTGAEAVDRKEGSKGVGNPRAGAGRTAKEVRNTHPTAKPIAIMKHCLRDIPTDAHVVDPFVGSGTTVVACVETGHSITAMEIDPEYMPIADARVRHALNRNVDDHVHFESDIDSTPERQEGSLDDLFFGSLD